MRNITSNYDPIRIIDAITSKITTSFRFLLVSRVLIAGLAVSGAAAPGAYALDFTVNSTSDAHDSTPGDGQCADAQGKCSLRAAIEENSRLPLPRIITLPSGTYNLTLGELEINVSMAILGAGSGTTFIDSNKQSRIFNLRNIPQTGWEPTVNMGGVTARNGKAPNSTSPGGGILISPGSTLSLFDCVVSGNESTIYGAGISNGGSLHAESCTIRDNTITGLTTGGGVTAAGGGIFNFGASPNGNFGPGFAELYSSTVSGNQATRGGGIDNFGTLRIQNSTISGNQAFAGGGGIRNVGTVWIAFSTITSNVANLGAPNEVADRRTGGGILNLGTISMSATILANNIDNRTKTDALYSPDCYSRTDANNGVFQSEGGNLDGIINQNCNLDLGYGGQAGTADNPLDSRLLPLLNNGGLTMTHALRTDSPAIDKDGGSGFFFGCPQTDQRGQSRPVGQACDAGAFELVVYTFTWPILVVILIIFILTIAMLYFWRARGAAVLRSISKA